MRKAMERKKSFPQFGWDNTYQDSRNREITYAVIMELVFVCGVVFDAFKIVLIPVQEIATVSLTSLQIQATLVGIPIALISLISGLNTESRYGISFCDYYMNRKAAIFTQKRVVIAAIILIGFGLFFHLLAWYNLVFSILLVSCGLIILSAMMLFSALSGKEHTEEELWAYIDYMLCSPEVQFEKKASAYRSFVNSWAPETENEVSFEREMDLFLRAESSLLEKDAESALPVIETVSSELIRRIASGDKTDKQLRAIDIFAEVHDTIIQYVESHDRKHIPRRFGLYNDCVKDLLLCYDQIQSPDYYRLRTWRRVVDTIVRVNLCCHDDDITDEASMADAFGWSSYFATQIGVRMASFGEKSREMVVPYDCTLHYSATLAKDLSEAVRQTYCLQKCQYEFHYYKALMENGAVDAAVSLFDNPYGWADNLSSAEMPFVFYVLIYTWYLAEKEKDEYVTENQRSYAKQASEQLRKRGVCQLLFYAIMLNREDLDYDSVVKSVYLFLENCEKIHINGEAKTCIMDRVINDFLFFTAVMACAYCAYEENHPFSKAVLKINNSLYWCAHYFNQNYEESIKTLDRMQPFFLSQIESEDRLRTGMDTLLRYANLVYKEYIINDAHKNAQEYSEKTRGNMLIEAIQQAITEYILKEKEYWLKEPTDTAEERSIVLLDAIFPVDLLGHYSEASKFPFSFVTGSLFREIINLLKEKHPLSSFVRNKESDSEYFQLLSDHQTATMVGSSFAFKPYNYSRREEYAQIISGMKQVHMESGLSGLLLTRQDVEIDITDGQLVSAPATIGNIQCSYDEKTGMYTYCPISDVPVQFTKEELEDYLRCSLIRLTYSVRLRFNIPDGDCGYLIERT